MFGRNCFNFMETTFNILTSLMEKDITINLYVLVNYKSCLNILDERKEESHGHSDCIRMTRDVPTLWIIQYGIQYKKASFPFINKVLLLDFSSGKSQNPFTSKMSFLKWATKGIGNRESALVCDSYYASYDSLSWIGKVNFFFFTSVNKL